MMGGKPGSHFTTDGSSPTLTRGRGSVNDVHAIALDGDKLKPREDRRGVAYGIGNGQAAEASATIRECSQTLNCMHDKQATVQCYDMTHTDDPGRKVADGVSPTLQSRMGTGGNQVPLAVSTNSSRDTEPLGIGRDVFNSGANASYSPDIRVGVQPTLTARTTQGAVCARLKGDE